MKVGQKVIGGIIVATIIFAILPLWASELLGVIAGIGFGVYLYLKLKYRL